VVTNILQEEASFHEYQSAPIKGALCGSHPVTCMLIFALVPLVSILVHTINFYYADLLLIFFGSD